MAHSIIIWVSMDISTFFYKLRSFLEILRSFAKFSKRHPNAIEWAICFFSNCDDAGRCSYPFFTQFALIYQEKFVSERRKLPLYFLCYLSYKRSIKETLTFHCHTFEAIPIN